MIILRYAALVILLIFIVGCGSGTETQPFTTPFIGGTDGLEISFLAQQPPDEIFDDKQFPFSVGVQIKNVGENNLEVNDGYVYLEGISPREYGISDAQLEEDMPAIEGARKNSNGVVVDGQFDVVTFDGLNYQQDIAGSIDSTEIRAVACYNYKTRVTTGLCVKESNVDFADNNDVCAIAGEKQVVNSGGPIHISRVQENAQGKNGVQVVLEISHVGNPVNKFFKVGSECNRLTNNPDRNRVFIEVNAIDAGSIPATCSGFQDGTSNSGYVFLPDAQPRQIFCTFDTSGVNNDFETPLNIELEYRYMETISKPIIIKDLSDSN
ncbi:MAG: hypothetical protein ACI8Y7_000311 [Candidatus Woesearchaeota archaeon]